MLISRWIIPYQIIIVGDGRCNDVRDLTSYNNVLTVATLSEDENLSILKQRISIQMCANHTEDIIKLVWRGFEYKKLDFS